MNYLAHAYLSFGHPEITVGNMISDFVKGRRKFDLPSGIQKGILLHREIDGFTDLHPASREARKIFTAAYRLYSSAFVDVTYDHFLAIDETVFPENELKAFSSGIYRNIEPHIGMLPGKFAELFPYMKGQDWLYNYRFRWGMEKSFHGLVRRAAYLSDSATAFSLFEKEYEYLQSCYLAFMPDMRTFAEQRFLEIAAEKE